MERQLIDLIGELVNEDGPWEKKRDKFLASLGEEQLINLKEFLGWFPEEFLK